MPKSRVISGKEENPTTSDSKTAIGRIRGSKSDGLQTRFREILAKESVSAFSRRSNVRESTLRNILNGAKPRADYLTAIADAAGVTIDWLSTGRPPKTRAELHAAGTLESRNMVGVIGKLEESGNIQPSPIDNDLLLLCLSACTAVHGKEFAVASPHLQLDYSADLYNQLLRMATANGGDLASFKLLETNGLADQLRLFLQMGWSKSFPPVNLSAWIF